MSNDAATTEDSRSAPPPSSASEERLTLLPVHVIVLVLLAVVALVAAQDAASSFQAGREAQAFTPEIRRAVGFGLLFNLAIAIALVLAWIIELVATLVRAARARGQASRGWARLAVALLPIVVFAVGHRVFNPWLPDLLRQVASLVRGG